MNAALAAPVMLALTLVGLGACSDDGEMLGTSDAADVGAADVFDAGLDADTDAGGQDAEAGIGCRDLPDEASCSVAVGVCKPHICRPCGELFYAGCYYEDDILPVCPTIECDGGV